MRFSSCFALGVTLLLTGCGKVPTWQELTSGQQPAAAPTTTVPSTPTTVVQSSQPAGPTPEEVIAKFKGMRSAEISDGAITQLTSLNQGLDQVTEINADGSAVSKDAFNSIDKLTNLRQLRLNGTRVNNEACAKIAALPNLEVLALCDTQVNDVGVAAISAMPNLKHLELVRCSLTDNGFAAIGNLPSLKTIMIEQTNLNNHQLDLVCNAKTLNYLMISKNPIDDYGLVALKKLGVLEVLELSSTRITGEGLVNAQKGGGLKSLQSLGMYSCPITEQGAKAISQIKSLERLNIGEITLMNDRGFNFIASGMKKLKYLNLSKCSGLDGSGLIALKGCVDLEELHIDQCPRIGDGVIPFLKSFKNLKILTVHSTAITPNGISALKSALPELNVQ